MQRNLSQNRGPKKKTNAAKFGRSSGTNPLLIAMIIDKSGSMSNLSADTVGGFNDYLADRQRETPDALMSVTLFDTNRDEMYVAEPVRQISKLTEARYRRGGMGYTALNDAIGGTIAAIDAGAYAEQRKVLVVVMTDGLENASKEWTSRAEIAALVKRKEAAGWKFVFFGADIDAFAEGAALNVPPARSVGYDKSATGVADTYRRMSRATSMLARDVAEETWVSELAKPRD
jgi:Mg-chelatase subunit ChlD